MSTNLWCYSQLLPSCCGCCVPRRQTPSSKWRSWRSRRQRQTWPSPEGSVAPPGCRPPGSKPDHQRSAEQVRLRLWVKEVHPHTHTHKKLKQTTCKQGLLFNSSLLWTLEINQVSKTNVITVLITKKIRMIKIINGKQSIGCSYIKETFRKILFVLYFKAHLRRFSVSV